MMDSTLAELDDLIEHEKRLAAREVHAEAWNDGLLEGIDAPFLVDAAVTRALEETVRLHGEDGALELLDALRERLVAGEFTPDIILQ